MAPKMNLTRYGIVRHLARIVPVVTLLLLSSGIVGAADGDLPQSVVDALRDAGIPRQHVAVVVQGVDARQPMLRVNAQQPMNPASTMKLVTTFAALDLLGPVHTWSTEALTDPAPAGSSAGAPIGNPGNPIGNLYLRGSGDPRLGLEQFEQLLRRLRARGIGEIGGDLVLDRSAFELPPHDPGEFDHEPLRPYNAGADALLINLKSIELTLHPDPAKQTVQVFLETPGEDQRVDNRLTLSGEACGDWREKLRVAVSEGTIELRGSLAAACGDKALNLSPWSADAQVERLFRALWRELGGSLRGRVRSGLTPPDARLLATQESPPLAEIVRETNKYSNNVMARQLYLSLSGERPATPAGARRALDEWLTGRNLAMPELVIENGSGLSRRERISADSLARLLLAAWKSPLMPELVASLPLAGADGTLKRRLGNSSASGRAHLKTGYLDGVRAIAGYLLDRSGRNWVVVVLINDPHARQGKAAIDALLQWLADR